MNVTRIDRTRLPRPLITCLFLCLGMACAVSLAASQQLERAWYGLYPLPAGGSVSVENVQGEISVEGWDRAEVEITAAKIGKDPDDYLEDVRVVTELGIESLAFRTVYPPHMDKPVRVNYRLRVPRQVHLATLRTLEGNIAVHSVEGSVDARTLSGNIVEMGMTAALRPGLLRKAFSSHSKPCPRYASFAHGHGEWQHRPAPSPSAECGSRTQQTGRVDPGDLRLSGQYRARRQDAPDASWPGRRDGRAADRAGHVSRRRAR